VSVSVGHTTRAIFFQVKLAKCKLLTLNDHNTYLEGSEEDIVSKQTILTCHSYTHCTIYTTENTKTTLPFCIYTLCYTVATHINYIGIHNNITQAEYMCTTQRETRKPFRVISTSFWQVGGNLCTLAVIFLIRLAWLHPTVAPQRGHLPSLLFSLSPLW